MMGNVLIVAALVAPLILFAMLFPRGLRPVATALRWLAPVPALLAAVFVLATGPAGFEARALRMSFVLDAPGAMLMLASAVLWIAAGVSGWAEASVERDDRFAACWFLTMAGSFGVFVAADLVTFYLVYALVSIPAYGLVVADGRPGAGRAGGIYMAFAILGEALLLGAFAALVAGEPNGSWRIADGVAALPGSPWRDAALALLMLGFGMKMALVPLNGWMPLTYTAAPVPAAAVLSGAGVKAGIIGLIRFLPLATALPGWGEALAVVGFVSAFYGVVVGLTQQNPKTILAYSSVSQMGVIATVLGLTLAAGQGATPAEVALYAANHVLVKGGLFLAIAALAASSGAGRRAVLILAALVALSLAGLPLTGGYLAKLAVKDAFGSGMAYALATASSAGTALLMTHFLFTALDGRTLLPPGEGGDIARRETGVLPNALWRRMRVTGRGEPHTPDPSPRGRGEFGRARATNPSLALWSALAIVAILGPWLLVPSAGLGGGLLDPGTLWAALWPTALGAALGVALTRAHARLPRVPEGDTVVLAEVGFARLLRAGPALDRADATLRGWPAGSLSLAAAALILAAAAFFG